MNTEPDQFEALRRLLKLKRYEAPPPGYFDQLARSIRAHLQADRTLLTLPWWQVWLARLEFRPAFAAALAGAAGGLYLIGIGLGGDATALSLSAGGLKLDPDPREWPSFVRRGELPLPAALAQREESAMLVAWPAEARTATSGPTTSLFAPDGPYTDSQRRILQRAAWTVPEQR